MIQKSILGQPISFDWFLLDLLKHLCFCIFNSKCQRQFISKRTSHVPRVPKALSKDNKIQNWNLLRPQSKKKIMDLSRAGYDSQTVWQSSKVYLTVK